MADAVLRDVAREIVQQGLLENWRFYLILLGLLLLSTAGGVFVTKYFGKRAELYATRSDLKELLRQLEATTKITEQVKVAVSHEDWIAREWKAIRRTKLEELVETAVSLTRWLDHQRSVLFFSVEQKSPEPLGDRVSMLVALYFPELEAESAAFIHAQRTAYAWLADIGNKALNNAVLSEREALFVNALPEWLPLYRAASAAEEQVKTKATSIMLGMRGA